tara:strand:+ start:158 stop:289 length:132 start_codon:yes stop_codon:yes gene_type:complete
MSALENMDLIEGEEEEEVEGEVQKRRIRGERTRPHLPSDWRGG